MSDEIKNALTAEQWASVAGEKKERTTTRQLEVDAILRDCDSAAVIAIENYRLDDSDPRKITRETIELLDAATRWCQNPIAHERPSVDALQQLGAALASYLPPDPLSQREP